MTPFTMALVNTLITIVCIAAIVFVGAFMYLFIRNFYNQNIKK